MQRSSCRPFASLAAVLAIPSLALPQAPSISVGTYLEELSETFGVSDGLPAGNITSLVARGDEIYAGTALGLGHWDGQRWESVPSFADGPVDTVVVDRSDGAVLATYGGGLYRVAPETERLAELPEGFREAGRVRVLAAHGPRTFVGGANGLRMRVESDFLPDLLFEKVAGGPTAVSDVAIHPDGGVAVAAEAGLFLHGADGWRAVYPSDGTRSWAPRNVQAVAWDDSGRLWFGSPQGAGRLTEGDWTLFEGKDGLPYNHFTSVAPVSGETIWFGTQNGALRFEGKEWRYRQGRRWLPDDRIRDVAVTADGAAWFATGVGVGRIVFRGTTLAAKARYLEEEIDKRHRRTPYGYVLGVTLDRVGDRSKWTQHDSDNDGLWTAMYGAGQCFAFAATENPKAAERAKAAFEALRFLGEVTQGGSHPAPKGYVARTVLPTSGRDPNGGRIERDNKQRAERDRSWKVIDPRWPVSADGQWYWKSDTSSDELDGHYFFYALYYDLVAKTEEEKARVRKVVVELTDLLVANDFNLIDHDGVATRWGHFSPRDLNHDPNWWEERGLNSLSVLAYLKVAEHVSGDEKYARAARELIEQHAYATNTLVPKNQRGVGSGNHSDDEMAFMGYYNLLRYEKDPELRSIYAFSFYNYWRLEYFERSPLFNFMYAGVASEETWEDAWGRQELRPRGSWLEDSVRYLRRYPRDRTAWGFRNSHRLDLVPLPGYTGRSGRGPHRGSLRDGKALPIDERFIEHWNQDPWQLDGGGGGRHLADGASFLLPYYLGLYHGFIRETGD